MALFRTPAGLSIWNEISDLCALCKTAGSATFHGQRVKFFNSFQSVVLGECDFGD
jgi:hypothetical protein